MKKEIIVPLNKDDYKCLVRGGVLEITIHPQNRKIMMFMENINDFDLWETLHETREAKNAFFRGHKKIVQMWKNLTEYLSNKKAA